MKTSGAAVACSLVMWWVEVDVVLRLQNSTLLEVKKWVSLNTSGWILAREATVSFPKAVEPVYTGHSRRQ